MKLFIKIWLLFSLIGLCRSWTSAIRGDLLTRFKKDGDQSKVKDIIVQPDSLDDEKTVKGNSQVVQNRRNMAAADRIRQSIRKAIQNNSFIRRGHNPQKTNSSPEQISKSNNSGDSGKPSSSNQSRNKQSNSRSNFQDDFDDGIFSALRFFVRPFQRLHNLWSLMRVN